MREFKLVFSDESEVVKSVLGLVDKGTVFLKKLLLENLLHSRS